MQNGKIGHCELFETADELFEEFSYRIGWMLTY